jgi:hypothetical protein
MGFDDLRRFAYQRGSMPVYASPETMRDLQRVFEFAFKEANPVPWYLKPDPHVIEGAFSLGSTMITPLPVPHGSTIVNGYLFTRNGVKLAAYLSDCSAVPDEIAKIIRDAGINYRRAGISPTATLSWIRRWKWRSEFSLKTYFLTSVTAAVGEAQLPPKCIPASG